MGKTRVAPSTRDRILAGARALNYAPNIHAKRLFSRKSNVIAFVIPSRDKRGSSIFRDIHLQEFFDGFETVLAEYGLHLLTVFNDRRFMDNRDYLSLFREKAVDGMLVWGAVAEEHFWPEVNRERYPVLFVTAPPLAEACHYMIHDYREAARLLLEQLAASGHRRIGWIASFRENGVTRDMDAGIQLALQRHPEVQVFTLYGDYSVERARKHAARLLEGAPEVSAVMAANTTMAEGIREELRAMDRRVPEDVALVACDCAGEAEASDITRVLVDDRLLARRSVEALLELASAPPSDSWTRVRLPVAFRLGETL